MDEDYLMTAKAEPLKRGSFRVVSRDYQGKFAIHDFMGFEDARRYANDVASNWSTEHFVARVFDDKFSVIYEGRSVADF
jgi:hypothetical protein